MRKIFKIFIISIAICAVSFASYAVDVTELQEKKEEIQTQIEQSNSELSNIDEELTANLQQIQKLDESIQKSNETIQKINVEISKLEKEIMKTQEDLQTTTNKYKTQKELLDTRLVTMYETEDTNYLDVLLGSKSFTEFISSYYLITEIASYDIDLLNIVQNQKEEIEKKSAILNEQNEKIQKERRTEQLTQIALENTKILRGNYIQKLNEEEQAIQAKIDEYNKQINDIEFEIKSLASTISFGEEYQGGPMKWPIYGYYHITSNYGMRTHPVTGVYKLHTGVDISAPMGADFTAMAKGVVVKAGYNTAYGNMVVIDHGGGVQTLYAHGSKIIADVGQEVEAGDVVLKVGSTGYSTGAHAHFEVRVNGTTVNPLEYVSAN